MSEIEQKSVWSEAGRAGLVLGGISIAYFLLTIVVPKIGNEIGRASCRERVFLTV